MTHRLLLPLGLSLALALTPLPLAAEDTAPSLPDMAEIERAWARSDFVAVRKGLAELAESTGTPLAQYRYGRVLIEGRGGPQDVPGAIDWLSRAVDQNHAEAATLLARIYLSNIPGGPARDATRAAELLATAAPRGNTEAQHLLGLLYQTGDGVPRDLKSALNWYLAAAENEHADSQLALARLYLADPKDEKNREAGMEWLRRSATNGVSEAQFELALALGDSSESIEWLWRAAEAGNPFAQRELGTRYLQGFGGAEANPTEAFRWLQAAAQAGDGGAMYNIGTALFTGTGTDRNLPEAARWFRAGAEQGLGRSMVALAGMMFQGAGVEKDPETALNWLRRALETPDSAQARLALGRHAIAGSLDGMVATERAVPWVFAAARNDAEGAEDWLAGEAANGMVSAQSALGRYLLETSTDRNEEAIALLTKAATRGDALGQFALAEALAKTGDYVMAHKWYNVSATLGHPQAPERRDVIGNLMTAEDIAKAQEEARTYFETEEPQPPAVVAD